MLRKINSNYIKRAMENRGEVTVQYGVFEKVQRYEYVEERIPFIGRIFPFAKRKVQKLVESEKPELVVKEIPVSEAQKLEEKPEILRKELDNIPYSRMFQLDPKVYGEGLFLGRVSDPKRNGQCYDIITKDGVLLGRFDMNDKGYYDPAKGLMPTEFKQQYNSSCGEASFDDVVAKYCAQNPETIEYIPEQLYEKYHNLDSKISSYQKEQDAAKTQQATLSKE